MKLKVHLNNLSKVYLILEFFFYETSSFTFSLHILPLSSQHRKIFKTDYAMSLRMISRKDILAQTLSIRTGGGKLPNRSPSRDCWLDHERVPVHASPGMGLPWTSINAFYIESSLLWLFG